MSFFIELSFDLFHYIAHYMAHKIPYIYVNFHKTHHQIHYPTSITAFYQHPVDYTMSNVIPLIMSFRLVFTYLIFTLTPYQLILILTYKTHIEISGHCGKQNNTPSFPQFIFFPKMLGISLYTKNHDRHHTENNCNYSKRFIIWDKLFGTFR